MENERTREIVGVVGDMRHEGLHAAPRPTVFVPHAQLPFGAMTFVVRAQSNPAAALHAMRAELAALTPRCPSRFRLRWLHGERYNSARGVSLALLVILECSSCCRDRCLWGRQSRDGGRTHEIGVGRPGAHARSILAPSDSQASRLSRGRPARCYRGRGGCRALSGIWSTRLAHDAAPTRSLRRDHARRCRTAVRQCGDGG